MLTYSLDRSTGKPLYELLYSSIRDDIINGNIKQNEKLPSKRNLAVNLNVSVNTVENAYSQLILEGFIHSEQGRGFFVNDIYSQKSENLTKKPVNSQENRPSKNLVREVRDEEIYKVEFKNNYSALSLFPFSVWSKIMRAVLSSQDIELLKTVPFNGMRSLREAISEHLKSFRGMNVDPDQIIVGAGSEYLYGRLLGLLGRDNIIAIEDPGYKKFAEISNYAGVLWDYIPIDESGMRINDLRQSKANLVHVSPANHFPTGTVMPIARRMELIEWAYSNQSNYIIEDDYDSELRYSGRMIPTIYSIDNRDKVIYMNTFSKSLVPSIRISYMILPPRLMNQYRRNLSFYSCTVSSFEQLTLSHFIKEGYFERHINRLRVYYREKRNAILKSIRNSRLAEFSEIKENGAGTHFMLKVDTELSDQEIHEAAEKAGIHIALLSDYEKNHSMKNSRTLIINYAGIDVDTIDEAVSCLEAIF